MSRSTARHLCSSPSPPPAAPPHPDRQTDRHVSAWKPDGRKEQNKVSEPHLSHDLQWSLSSIFSTDCELGRLVDQAASLLNPGPESLDLCIREFVASQLGIVLLIHFGTRP